MKKSVKIGPMATRYFRAEKALADELFEKSKRIEGEAEARIKEAISVIGSEAGEMIPFGASYNLGADGSCVFEWQVADVAPAEASKSHPCSCHEKKDDSGHVQGVEEVTEAAFIESPS